MGGMEFAPRSATVMRALAASEERPMTTASGEGQRPTDTQLLAGYRQLATVLGVLLGERGIGEVLAKIAETIRDLIVCDDVVIWGCADDELRAVFTNGA